MVLRRWEFTFWKCLSAVLIATNYAACEFYGGTCTWAPTGNGTEVRISSRLSWDNRTVHCDKALIDSRKRIAFVDIICFTPGCLMPKQLSLPCTDQAYGWVSGRLSFKFSPPPGITRFKFGINTSAIDRQLHLITTADVGIRDDIYRINSSPVVDMFPEVYMQPTCNQTLKLPAYDPDGDIVRCRFANSKDLDEVEWTVPPGVSLTDDCILSYTGSGRSGSHMLSIQVEDFPYAAAELPLSSVGLQFWLLTIDNGADRMCDIDSVWHDGQSDVCIDMNTGQQKMLSEEVTGNLDIIMLSNEVSVSPESNISVNDSYSDRIIVSWTPTVEEKGRHNFCFMARNLTAGWSATRCGYVYVEGEPILKRKEYTVSHDTVSWKLIYDKAIRRPGMGKILLIFKKWGNTSISVLDSDVKYGPSNIIFSYYVPYYDQEHRVFFQSGIAVGGCEELSIRSRTPVIHNGCSRPIDVLNGTWNVTSYLYNGTVTAICDDGYAITGGNEKRTCEGDGVWSGIQPTCTENGLYCEEAVDRYGKWERTPLNLTANKTCPDNGRGLITRHCDKGGNFSSAFNNCSKEVFNTIYDRLQNKSLTPSDALNDLKEEINTTTDLSPGDLDAVTEIMMTVVESGWVVSATTLEEDAKTFMQIANQLSDPEKSGPGWHVKLQQTGKGSEKFIQTVDLYGLKVAEKMNASEPIFIKQDNLVLTAVGISKDSKTFKYPLSGSEKPFANTSEFTSFILEKADLLDGDTSAVVVVFRNMTKALPTTMATADSSSDKREINSQIMSIQLYPPPSDTLLSPVIMKFPINKHAGDLQSQCSFWQTEKNGSKAGWSTRGCVTEQHSSTMVQCSCNHLTNFAILMSPAIANQHHSDILSTITYTGCGISICFLIVTILLHVLYWRSLRSTRNQLAMVVCVSLLIAYILFVAGVGLTRSKTLCKVVAVLLHYTYLVVFFAILAEALFMAKQVVFVFHRNSHIKEMLCAIFVLPFVIVLSVACATMLKDYGNEKYCWMTVNSTAFWMFVGPVLLICLINFVVIVIVMRKLYGTKMVQDMDKRKKAKTLASKMCVLVPVMGVTWLFGVLAIDEDSLPLQYLFVIFNSLQGVFIFVFHVLLNRKLKTEMCGKKDLTSMDRLQETASKAKKSRVRSAMYSVVHRATRLFVGTETYGADDTLTTSFGTDTSTPAAKKLKWEQDGRLWVRSSKLQEGQELEEAVEPEADGTDGQGTDYCLETTNMPSDSVRSISDFNEHCNGLNMEE